MNMYDKPTKSVPYLEKIEVLSRSNPFLGLFDSFLSGLSICSTNWPNKEENLS
jgi:hypothetical protein